MKIKKLLAVLGLTAIIAGSSVIASENCTVQDSDDDDQIVVTEDPNEIDENEGLGEIPAE